MGLSFWLVPTRAEEREALRKGMEDVRSSVMARLSDGVDMSAPFPPHVTLLTGISDAIGEEYAWHLFEEALRVWQQHAHCSPDGISCPLDSISSRGLYYQCIVLTINLHQSQNLADLNQRMRQIFNLERQDPYWPHLSLVYAHLNKDEALEQIRHLDDEQYFQISSDGIAFGSLCEPDRRLQSVYLGAVELWMTGEDVGQWRLLKRRSLCSISSEGTR